MNKITIVKNIFDNIPKESLPKCATLIILSPIAIHLIDSVKDLANDIMEKGYSLSVNKETGIRL